MVAPFSTFYGKIWVGFCLNTGKHFFFEISFRANRKSIGYLKSGTKDYQNNPPFERSACFYATISGKFERFQYFNERFQYFNFEIDFLENENLFRKTELPFFN